MPRDVLKDLYERGTRPPISRWSFEHGSYYLYGPSGDIRWMTDQVAIGYDVTSDGPVIMKHGPPDMVTQWAEQAAARYREAGFEPEVAVLTLPRGFPAEEINRCIDTAGYLATVLEQVEKEHGDGGGRAAIPGSRKRPR